MVAEDTFKSAVDAVASLLAEFKRNNHVPTKKVQEILVDWVCHDSSEEDWSFSSQGMKITFDSPNRIFLEYHFVDEPTEWRAVVFLTSLRNEGTILYHMKGSPTPGNVLENELGFRVCSNEEELLALVSRETESKLAYLCDALMPGFAT